MDSVKKIVMPLWLVAMAVVALPVSARMDCPLAPITHIQIEGNRVIYLQQGGPWRGLGTLTDAGVKERYSAMLAAQMAGRKVLVGYSDGFDCKKTNYDAKAVMVRTH